MLTVGGGDFESGFDVMLNGTAERVTGHKLLCSLAEDYVAKYGEDWRFTVHEGTFRHTGDGVAEVYRIGAETAYGFGRGIASHTRWRW